MSINRTARQTGGNKRSASSHSRYKRKANHTPMQKCRQSVHLPSFGDKPVGGYTTKSVAHGQCDARPMVTFPAAEHNHSLADTKLYCLVTEAHRCK